MPGEWVSSTEQDRRDKKDSRGPVCSEEVQQGSDECMEW